MRAAKLVVLALLATLLMAACVAAQSTDNASEPAAETDSGSSTGVEAPAEESAGAEAAEPEDECSAASLEDYNLGLHIGSVFILLAVSLGGAVIPVLLSIGRQNTFTMTGVKFGTFFGIGTILSTAFIHMLLPANANLSSPCLPESWTESYEAWAYMFAVVSILAMQLIDFVIEGAYLKMLAKGNCEAGAATPHMISVHASRKNVAAHEEEHAAGAGTSKAAAADVEAGECVVHGGSCKPLVAGMEEADASEEAEVEAVTGASSAPVHMAKDPSQVVGVYLMEAGIVFHSVLIGITLGVTAGSSFTTLLIALSFHQFFEGFAIGSAAIDSGVGTFRAFIMAGIYAVTTPIGIAIGIGVRESFNENSKQTLLTEGILDALSAGILIYVVLVELLNPLMTQSAWLRSRRWPIKVASFACLYAGAAVMAVIGTWV